MTTLRLARPALWVLALLLVVGTLKAAWISTDGGRASSPTSVADAVVLFDSTSLASAADTVIDNDPFRLDRAPADIGFGQDAVTAPQSPPLQFRQPPPRLTAVLGGPPWRAVLEGVPGREGSVVVSPGDRVGPFAVLTISRTLLKLKEADTTWHLHLRE